VEKILHTELCKQPLEWGV